jgi:hypothetical protein
MREEVGVKGGEGSAMCHVSRVGATCHVLKGGAMCHVLKGGEGGRHVWQQAQRAYCHVCQV